MNVRLTRLYFNSYKRAVEEAVEHIDNEKAMKDIRKRIALYGVRYIAMMPQSETRKEAESDLQFISILKQILAKMTLNEFMNVFPIKKEYDGEKWGVKDYFSTIEEIQGMDPLATIGKNIDHLLAEYWNDDIYRLFVAMIQVVNDIDRHNHRPTFTDLWAADMGLDTTNVQQHNGKKFLIHNGKPYPIDFNKASHLKTIQGGLNL